MTRREILDRVDELRLWTRGSERAPHKPLLLLLALAGLQRGETVLRFSDCAAQLTELLREFGPSRASYHPEYPFWHLQNDGLWRVTLVTPPGSRRSNTDPTRGQLLAGGAVGSFPEDVRTRLARSPTLVAEIAGRLLSSHFPESLHQDILDAVGLSTDRVTVSRRRRDPEFRARVLTAYEHRCALCGLDLRIGNMTVAIEAAHIQWHQAGGPDTETNGVALCSLHHKVFDVGVFTIHTDLRVLVSELAHGMSQFEEAVLRHHAQPLRRPLRPEHTPGQGHLAWHRRDVFKEPSRPVDVA